MLHTNPEVMGTYVQIVRARKALKEAVIKNKGKLGQFYLWLWNRHSWGQ